MLCYDQWDIIVAKSALLRKMNDFAGIGFGDFTPEWRSRTEQSSCTALEWRDSKRPLLTVWWPRTAIGKFPFFRIIFIFIFILFLFFLSFYFFLITNKIQIKVKVK